MAEPNSVKVVMLARDEQGRVGRALASVRDHVSSWLVIDTGSTDGTMAEVSSTMARVPGHLVESSWVSFGANRTELLTRARALEDAEWLLTLDADHELLGGEQLHPLVVKTAKTVDAIALPFEGVPMQWTMRLLRSSKPWRYRGSTREFLDCDEPYSRSRAENPVIRDHADGASRAEKWSRDIAVLRAELGSDSNDARRWFYLGESYRGAGDPASAAAAYTNCALLTEAPEERYLALTLSGEMLAATGDSSSAIERFLMADAERPQRREALLLACQLLNDLGRHGEVRRLLGRGPLARPVPTGDTSGIIPGAYGPLMRQQLARAQNTRRKRHR